MFNIVNVYCPLGKRQEADELSGDASVEEDSMVKVILEKT